MSLLSAFFTLVPIISRPVRPPKAIPVPPMPENPDNLRPAPTTRADAQRMLIDQLIIGLRERPQDFSASHYHLSDKATGMEWWIANGQSHFALASVAGCGCRNLTPSNVDQERGWKAFQGWQNTPTGAAEAPETHEAIRLWKANQKAAR